MVFVGRRMASSLSLSLSPPLRYSFQAEVPSNARVSRNRNGVELPCIKISILDCFSDIRAWIYDIISRASEQEGLEMLPGTVLAGTLLKTSRNRNFGFHSEIRFRLSRENDRRACNLVDKSALQQGAPLYASIFCSTLCFLKT